MNGKIVSAIPPLGKGGLGGISNRERDKIPLNPPLSKGDFNCELLNSLTDLNMTLAMADRAVGQLADLDVVAAHQLGTEFLLRHCWHPVHLKNIFDGTDEALRLAVT
jgi:hypothetical protein